MKKLCDFSHGFREVERDFHLWLSLINEKDAEHSKALNYFFFQYLGRGTTIRCVKV